MSYYERHVFFCGNQPEGNGRPCCNGKGASSMRDYAKQRVYRCDDGPRVAVYPDAVWYTYIDRADIDEIIEKHLQYGRVVERLRI